MTSYGYQTGVKSFKCLYTPRRCGDVNCISCTIRTVELYNVFEERNPESAITRRLWTNVRELKGVTDCQLSGKALSATVVKMSIIRAPDENIPAKRVKVSIADATGAMNMFISGGFDVKFEVGQSVIVTQFVVRHGAIQITQGSRITRRDPVALSENRKTEAEKMFDTPFFPLRTLRSIVHSRDEFKVTVKGVVTDVGFMSVYANSHGNIRYKRFIRIQEGADFILMLLHSSASAHCTDELGDVVIALDVKAMWCTISRRVLLIAVFEDQLKVLPSVPVVGEFVILSFVRTAIRNMLWCTVQDVHGIRKLYLETEIIGIALEVEDVSPGSLQQYLPVRATGTIVGSFVQQLDIVRHRQLVSTVTDDDGLLPDITESPVTVPEVIDSRYTVETVIDLEEGYYLSDISDC